MAIAPGRPRGSKLAEQPSLPAEALAAIHRRLFFPLVRRVEWKHGLSTDDACDLVQEAFVLALVKLRRDGNPKAWLIAAVDHLAVNLKRKRLRRAHLAARWGLSESPGERFDTTEIPENLDGEEEVP